MRSSPMDRKSFLARAGRLFGGIFLAGAGLRRVQADAFSGLGERTASKAVGRFSRPRLDLLKEAFESRDVRRLISLLHPRVQWWGSPPQEAPG